MADVLWAHRTLWRGEKDGAVAGMEKVIPEGKSSILCTLLKFCLCVLGFSTVHTPFCASGRDLSRSPGVSSGPSCAPVPRNDRILKTWLRVTHGTYSLQTGLPVSLLRPCDALFCDQKCLRRKRLPISLHALMPRRTELAFGNLHQKSRRSLH